MKLISYSGRCQPLWKIWKAVGIMTFPNKNPWFQTTNQVLRYDPPIFFHMRIFNIIHILSIHYPCIIHIIHILSIYYPYIIHILIIHILIIHILIIHMLSILSILSHSISYTPALVQHFYTGKSRRPPFNSQGHRMGRGFDMDHSKSNSGTSGV